MGRGRKELETLLHFRVDGEYNVLHCITLPFAIYDFTCSSHCLWWVSIRLSCNEVLFQSLSEKVIKWTAPSIIRPYYYFPKELAPQNSNCVNQQKGENVITLKIIGCFETFRASKG